ncbi:MAG: hypothetical protein KatS3mg082_2734 [Nitrospiraceae bacterium]|nr:MAG: hypothetical protein KatS3mg082_2542 [Nitrospiraceae bacterium]GIW56330.1 MAG: hypothetical protein KatS3mg082_2734 [Nitrospiraceae bacterium]GIW81337.1 MAG: hypothetical protein KatS3mg105_3144 [Gemmatales bacterium]
MAMAEARSRAAWDHTSNVMALVANCLARTKGKPPFQPRMFHPFLRRKPPALPLEKSEAFALMREVFVNDGSSNTDPSR